MLRHLTVGVGLPGQEVKQTCIPSMRENQGKVQSPGTSVFVSWLLEPQPGHCLLLLSLSTDPTHTWTADPIGKHFWPSRVDTVANHHSNRCHFSQSWDFPSRLIYHRVYGVAHLKPCACSAGPFCLRLHPSFSSPCLLPASLCSRTREPPFCASQAAGNMCSPDVLMCLFTLGRG